MPDVSDFYVDSKLDHTAFTAAMAAYGIAFETQQQQRQRAD